MEQSKPAQGLNLDISPLVSQRASADPVLRAAFDQQVQHYVTRWSIWNRDVLAARHSLGSHATLAPFRYLTDQQLLAAAESQVREDALFQDSADGKLMRALADAERSLRVITGLVVEARSGRERGFDDNRAAISKWLYEAEMRTFDLSSQLNAALDTVR